MNNKSLQFSNIFPLLNLINKCKESLLSNDDFELLLKQFDKNIYKYLYFIPFQNMIIQDKESSKQFMLSLEYKEKSFHSIDLLNLKRGFIYGLTKDSNDYLLKYQPNKSFMELVINCYLKSMNDPHFLLPNHIFINHDYSYFYIIQKYKTDLYNFFAILENDYCNLTFENIFSITIFLLSSINILHQNNIIHGDLKLENVVLNYDEKNKITSLKIIDFDVALFKKLPDHIITKNEKYEKILCNKKTRGTRIYMLKNESMDFQNDVYSLGVLLLVILYKNTKLILILHKKKLCNEDVVKNKKNILKYQSFIKKMTKFRDIIEDDANKIKLLHLILKILSDHHGTFFNEKYNLSLFKIYRNLIISCIQLKYNIQELIMQFENIFI